MAEADARLRISVPSRVVRASELGQQNPELSIGSDFSNNKLATIYVEATAKTATAHWGWKAMVFA